MVEFILFVICMCLPTVLVIIFDVLQSKEMDKFRTEVTNEINLMNNRIDVMRGLSLHKSSASNGKKKTKK
jgi:hypothetical protein